VTYHTDQHNQHKDNSLTEITSAHWQPSNHRLKPLMCTVQAYSHTKHYTLDANAQSEVEMPLKHNHNSRKSTTVQKLLIQ